MNTRDENMENMRATAASFVVARLAGNSLASYPGNLPSDAAAAYACQDVAIALWPEQVAGWKVGLVGAEASVDFGSQRLVGPIFSHVLRRADTAAQTCAVFTGGFAAVEAEFAFCIGHDTSPMQVNWTPAQAADMVKTMHASVEIASSPLASINDLGPAVTASDFGNNFGLLVGPTINQWRSRELETLQCETTINGRVVGQGSAASIPGGPLAALAFALSHCARRGYPLRAGQYVCTGAATGVHSTRPGDIASVHFQDIGTIVCNIVAAGKYPVGGQV